MYIHIVYPVSLSSRHIKTCHPYCTHANRNNTLQINGIMLILHDEMEFHLFCLCRLHSMGLVFIKLPRQLVLITYNAVAFYRAQSIEHWALKTKKFQTVCFMPIILLCYSFSEWKFSFHLPFKLFIPSNI